MRKLTIASAMIIAAIATLSTSLNAQSYTCKCVNGIKCEDFFDANGNLIASVCDPNITCQGDFVFTEPPIPPAGPIDASGEATNIQATVDLGDLGKATISLNPDQPSVATTVKSNGDERFPATVDINFYAIATTDAGKEFESTAPLNYSSSNVNSIDPFKDEKLTLQKDIDFVERGTDGPVVFTLRAQKSSLTLGR